MRNLQSLIYLILLLGVSQWVGAQTTLKGTVRLKTTKKPLESAIVTLNQLSDDNIMGFATTDHKGNFEIEYTSQEKECWLYVKSISIKPLKQRIAKSTQYVVLEVEEEAFQLEEVSIKASKMQQRGDTIDYNVFQFTDMTDRSIEDVMKKLPGIKISNDGAILYKNKPINKFYVEGLDLLQGKYSMATKNMDASKVATVQVLENHQPIKMLHGVDVPDEAAINLKLKDSSTGTFFGNGQVGVGASPLLYSNELVFMRFARAKQEMFVYKGDNSGRDVTRELTSFYGGGSGGGTRFLGLQTPSSPNILQQHYLYNQAHVASFNAMRKVGKDLYLTLQGDFLFDRQKKESVSYEEHYLENGDTVRIDEVNKAKLYNRATEGSALLEGNTDSYFLNNKTDYKIGWSDGGSSLVTPTHPIRQNLSTPFWNISNNFKYRFKNTSDISHQFSSYIFTQKSENTLKVNPSQIGNLIEKDTLQAQPISQNVDLKTWGANVKYTQSRHLFEGFNMENEAFFNVSQSQFDTSLDYYAINVPLVADSLRNNLRRTEALAKIGTIFRWKVNPHIYLYLRLPLEYHAIGRKDKIRDDRDHKNYFRVNPRFRFHYYWRTYENVLSLNYSSYYQGINSDYQGYIMSNYRMLNRNDDLFSTSSSFSVSNSLSYTDPLSVFVFDWNAFYRLNHGNSLTNSTYYGVLSQQERIYYKHDNHSFGTHLSGSKSIDAIQTELDVSLGFSFAKRKMMNQEMITSSYSKDISFRIRSSTRILANLVFSYRLSGSRMWYRIGDNSLSPMNNFNQYFDLAYSPWKKVMLTTSANHYYNNQMQGRRPSTWFGNVALSYKTNKVEWMLDWTNVFNTKEYITSSYSDFGHYYHAYNIRPTEVLLRVKFKLF